MGPRWKGKGSEAKALAEPISKIVLALSSSLATSPPKGLLLGNSVLLDADPNQSEHLNRACFGHRIDASPKDTQMYYELGLEEAFYLCYALKCLNIVGDDGVMKTYIELWDYMTKQVWRFPEFYNAYCHLRKKNWVVRPGSQYGVDYVAYRHHPALVHSEYAVIVQSNGNDGYSGRLRVWSDIYCTVRLCGGVAKTLLVLYVKGNGSRTDFPVCVTNVEIEEREIRRWIPEKSREEKADVNRRAKGKFSTIEFEL